MIKWHMQLAGLLTVGWLAGIGQTEAQPGAGQWTRLMEEERSGLEALAMYPKEVREAILVASGEPVLLVRLEVMQAESREAFRSLLSPYPQETQEVVWNTARYPGLVGELVRTDGAATGDYPVELRSRAMESYRSYPALYEALFERQQDWENSLDTLLAGATPAVSWSVRMLMDHPEVLEIMQENLRLTVLSGDLYQRNPGWMLARLDTLHDALVAAREVERQDWQRALEENPAAKDEYVAAANAFQEAYGYDDALYEGPNLAQDRDGELAYWTTVHVAPYPYWLGYPYWYGFPRWRPYPWWYFWGAYWRADQVLVIIDLPMPVFTYWYFYSPRHHRLYPHFSAQLTRHYYGHRTMGSPVAPVIDRWRTEHADLISEEWLSAAGSEPSRFAAFGEFELDRDEYNRSHPKQPLGRSAFLDKKARKYPELTKSRDQVQAQVQQPPVSTARPSRRTEPIPPAETRPPVRSGPPTGRSPTDKQDRPPTPKAPTQGIPETDRAKIYHRETLEKVRRQQPDQNPPPKAKSDIRSRQPAPKPAQKPKTSPKPARKQPAAPSRNKPAGKGNG